MPAGAAEIIRNNLEWSTPVALVGRIQEQYPIVTANQIHAAWTTMSEVMWKRDKDQLASAKLLLSELHNDIDVFDIEVDEGVQQVCWGMKKIANLLKGKVVEIAIDATCQSNPHHCRPSLTTVGYRQHQFQELGAVQRAGRIRQRRIPTIILPAINSISYSNREANEGPYSMGYMPS
jgi:hypothetical protein